MANPNKAIIKVGDCLFMVLFSVVFSLISIKIRFMRNQETLGESFTTHLAEEIWLWVVVWVVSCGFLFFNRYTSHNCSRGGGEEPKFCDDKTINNNSNNNSCRNIRLYASYGRSNSSLNEFTY